MKKIAVLLFLVFLGFCGWVVFGRPVKTVEPIEAVYPTPCPTPVQKI